MRGRELEEAFAAGKRPNTGKHISWQTDRQARFMEEAKKKLGGKMENIMDGYVMGTWEHYGENCFS